MKILNKYKKLALLSAVVLLGSCAGDEPLKDSQLDLSTPPKKKASSSLTFHCERVLITLSWAGEFLAVIKAVRIGVCSWG